MADRSVVYRLRADIGTFRAQMAQAGASVKDAGDKMTAAGKDGEKFRKGLDSLGGAAGKIGLVAAAGLGAAVLAAANFDKSMSQVQAATHESASNMELLRAAAIKAGADTQYSATEAAGAIEELAKAGVSTKNVLAGGLSGALNLAAAGGLEVSDAAEIAASALTQFGLAGKDVPHVADLLSAGAGKAQGSVQDLGYALKYAGVPAHSLGVSIEETTGVLAEFASAGIVGEQAGTTLRSMLLSLAAPTKKAQELMDGYGLQLYDAQGKFIGLEGAAGQLQSVLGPLTEAERNHALSVIFGKEAIQGAIQLYNGGADAVQEWTGKVNDAGYAAETASTRMDNLAGDLEQFKGSLETALIGAGEGSQAPLRSLVQNATDVVNAYNKLPPSIQGATTSALGLVAITGGAAWFGAKVIRSVADTRQALSDLGFTAGRTGGTLSFVAKRAAGIATAAAAVTALGNALAKANGAVLNTSDVPRNLEALAKGGASDTLKRITDDLEILGQTSTKAAEPIRETFTAFGLFGNTPLDNAQQNIEDIDQALAGLVESGNAKLAEEAFQRIADASGKSASEVREKFDAYSTALYNAGEGFSFLKPAIDAVDKVTSHYARTTQRAKEKQVEMTKAQLEQAEAARKDAGAFVNLGKNVDKAKVSLDDWIKHFDRQAKALRDFRENAQQAAKRGLDDGLIASLEKAGPEGALRMKQLAGATKEQLDTANKAWRGAQREVDKYGDFVAGIPSAKTTRVNVEDGAAFSILQRLDNFAFRDKFITVHTVRASSDGVDFQHGAVPKAYGGTVPGVRAPYGDKTLILAAPGEEVITNINGEADRFRADRAAGRIPSYAYGGTIGQSQPTSPTPAVRVELGDVQLRGTLHSAHGPVSVEGIARTVARQEIQSDRAYQQATGPRRTTRRGRD